MCHGLFNLLFIHLQVKSVAPALLLFLEHAAGEGEEFIGINVTILVCVTLIKLCGGVGGGA